MLHTSDWHLGRSFGQVSLAADQAAFVDWLVDVVGQESIDLVVVAGDLYDRAIPPTESVNLLRHALTGIVGAGAKVVAIAGNHDSPDRVAAADGLTDAAGVIIRGGFARAGETVTLEFSDGPLDVVAVPYLDPVMAPNQPVHRRRAPDLPLLPDHDAPAQLAFDLGVSAAATRDEPDPDDAPRRPTHQTVLKAALHRRVGAPRSVAVAHAFVAGAIESDSERALAVGTSPRVATTTFDGFSYVALGHLHRPQLVGADPTRRYCGSPLPYSFSETHAKHVVIVDVDPTGRCTTTEIPVPVGRPVVTLTGTIDDLLMSPRHAHAEHHFVRAVLTDPSHVLDAKARLLHRYRFVTEIVLQPPAGPDTVADPAPAAARSRLSPLDAATSFWSDVTNRPPTHAEREMLHELLDAALAEATP
ncbi:metallophosphoesterase family protein [Desertimonas flava]|uniref:metallophosphoesterase family protein n=1 Tax=Desertimonas flava TaxID=2064846 RepID=UPI000E3516AC|nr:exonuclease SbcCD subunit D [Desertimonas flava]